MGPSASGRSISPFAASAETPPKPKRIQIRDQAARRDYFREYMAAYRRDRKTAASTLVAASEKLRANAVENLFKSDSCKPQSGGHRSVHLSTDVNLNSTPVNLTRALRNGARADSGLSSIQALVPGLSVQPLPIKTNEIPAEKPAPKKRDNTRRRFYFKHKKREQRMAKRAEVYTKNGEVYSPGMVDSSRARVENYYYLSILSTREGAGGANATLEISTPPQAQALNQAVGMVYHELTKFTHITGEFFRRAICQQAEVAFGGKVPPIPAMTKLTAQMKAAYTKYFTNLDQLVTRVKPVEFFDLGMWRNENLWHWKKPAAKAPPRARKRERTTVKPQRRSRPREEHGVRF